MNLEQAKKIGAPYEQNKDNKVIIITSDHGVFLGVKDDNEKMIMSVCKHAVRTKLAYFFIKGDEPTSEEIQAAIDEEASQYYNSKVDDKTIAQDKIDEKAFKELIKSGKQWADKKNWQKARNEFAQAMKLRPDNGEAKQLHDEAYEQLVEGAKVLDENAKAEQAKRDELLRKLGLNGDASDDDINDAIAKRDAQNASKKAADATDDNTTKADKTPKKKK